MNANAGKGLRGMSKFIKMQISRLSKKNSEGAQPAQFRIDSLQSLTERNKEGKAPVLFDDMYLIILILKGVGEVSLDTESFLINEKVVCYAKPGQVIKLELDDDASGYSISFAKEFVELTEIRSGGLFHTPFFNRFGTVPIIHIGDDAIVLMTSIADKMIQEYNNFLDLRSDILIGYLKIFMIYLCRQLQQENQGDFWSRKSGLVQLFFAQLEKHYTSKKRVKEYAEILAVSPNYLNVVVKELSGHPASHHIKQRIVLEAKRRVLYEGYSLKETAYDLGFWDPAHFSRYFKNCSGVNFTDFKKGFSI